MLVIVWLDINLLVLFCAIFADALAMRRHRRYWPRSLCFDEV